MYATEEAADKKAAFNAELTGRFGGRPNTNHGADGFSAIVVRCYSQAPSETITFRAWPC